MDRLVRGILLPILLAGFTQWACRPGKESGGSDPSQAPRVALGVKVAPVEVRDWTVTVPISGSLHSQSIVEIRSEVGGRLEAAHFREGEQVRKDQVLAEIDSTNYKLAYDQAAAALAVAQAGLERARVMAEHANREKERAVNLLRSGGITEKDHQAAMTGVKDAESQVRLAEAQCAQARATLAVAEKSLRDCRILAPAQGQVQKKFFDQGSLLSPGSPLYTLVDNSRLELDCLLPAYRLSEVHPGQRAAFTTPTWGARLFDGTVAAINPVIETDNRSVRVTLRIVNKGGELRSGMYARGEIMVRHESAAMVVPRSALLAETEESSAGNVYIIKGGKAQRRAVQIGGVGQDLLWIRQGLHEGDQVIVEVGPALREGTEVRVASQLEPAGSSEPRP